MDGTKDIGRFVRFRRTGEICLVLDSVQTRITTEHDGSKVVKILKLLRENGYPDISPYWLSPDSFLSDLEWLFDD